MRYYRTRVIVHVKEPLRHGDATTIGGRCPNINVEFYRKTAYSIEYGQIYNRIQRGKDVQVMQIRKLKISF
jgi:hypothetical protein